MSLPEAGPALRAAQPRQEQTSDVCSNPTPPEYRENTGPDGRRRDADVRPELCKGSVDFLASSPVYAVCPATELLFDPLPSTIEVGRDACLPPEMFAT